MRSVKIHKAIGDGTYYTLCGVSFFQGYKARDDAPTRLRWRYVTCKNCLKKGKK